MDYVRIILRYLAMFLVAKGILSPELGDMLAYDPYVQMGFEAVIGFAIGAGVELWYLVVRSAWIARIVDRFR